MSPIARRIMKFRIRSHTEVHAYRTAFALVAILAVCVIGVQLGVLGSANTGEADPTDFFLAEAAART